MPKWAVCFGLGGFIRDTGEVLTEDETTVTVKSKIGTETWKKESVRIFPSLELAANYFAGRLKDENGSDPGNPW